MALSRACNSLKTEFEYTEMVQIPEKEFKV
jgi:hypothetical protein